jgi:hypothetical protein
MSSLEEVFFAAIDCQQQVGEVVGHDTIATNSRRNPSAQTSQP